MPYQHLKHSTHNPLICSPYVDQSEGHYLEGVNCLVCDKSCLRDVLFSHFYLIVLREGIQEANQKVVSRGVDELLYGRERI